jgi:cysteine desulfurase/selenocysteine lyase
MSRFYAQRYANVHRGVYRLAEEATEAYEAVRDKVAHLVGAHSRSGVVFTKNCTEAINLVAYAWARRRLRPGDEVVVSALEHHSNLVPWQEACRASGATLRHMPLDDALDLDLSQLDRIIGPRTRLVAVTGLSNVLGTITPLEPIVAAARAVGALVLVDGAQLVMRAPVDLRRLGADFFAFSGHKILGPTGVGALVARPELLEEMDPFLTGGEMVLDVTLERATWNEVPHKFEAGTPMIVEVIGMGEAIDYIEELGLGAIREHDRRLRDHGLSLLRSVAGLVLYGEHTAAERVATFCFNLVDDRGELIHPHDVGTFLADEGIAIRVGHHCAQPLMRCLGVPATCRASCSVYNTAEELTTLAGALARARAFFGGRPRG